MFCTLDQECFYLVSLHFDSVSQGEDKKGGGQCADAFQWKKKLPHIHAVSCQSMQSSSKSFLKADTRQQQ